MEQLGTLPSAEAVLDKLKSDGTFDQFRKTCSAAIEAESLQPSKTVHFNTGTPSFRAHGEHIEVLSRRYLQDFNWKENTTRNEVRSKLRQHMLGVISSPELHIGLPLSALLEKTLEAKSKDLLPQIMDAVETLRAVKTQQNTQYDSRNPPPLTGSQTTTSISTSNTTELLAASAPNKKASSELGSLDLDLPIDIIPGLSAPKKDPATGGAGGGGESKPVKPKLKLSDGTTMKDGAKGPTRPKTAVASGNKGTVAVKEIVKMQKEREKEDSRGAVEKEGVSEEVSKEKVKVVSKPRTLKEEAKEKSVTGQKESSEKPPQDRVTLKSLVGGGKEKDKYGDAKKGGKKEAAKNEPNKGELRSEQKEQSKTDVPKGSDKESDVQLATAERESQVQETVAVSGASRRKQHTPTRRSARIASISELREESKPEVEDKGHLPPGQESGGSESDDGVEKKQVKQQKRRKRPRDAAKATSSSRKKARVLLSSSSEDSEIEKESGADSEDKEQGYESETEQPKEEDEKPSKKLKSKSIERRKARECELTSERQSRRSRKHARSQSQATQSQYQPKKLKKIATKHSGKTSIFKKRFKLKLHRFSSVKTRYNRLVKPNRKYSPYGELSNTESENSEEQREEEEEENKEEVKGKEEKGGSDSEEGRENISEEELLPKTARRTRK